MFIHTSTPMTSKRPVSIHPIHLVFIESDSSNLGAVLEGMIWRKYKKYGAGTCAAIVGNGHEENR
jgi:hypothetical protein